MRGIRVGMQRVRVRTMESREIRVGMMGMWGIRVEMRGTGVGMPGIRVGMPGIGGRNKGSQSKNLRIGVQMMNK